MTMRYILCFYVILGVAVAGVEDPAHRIIFWAAIGAMILIIHRQIWREHTARLRRYATARRDRAASGEPSPALHHPADESHPAGR